MIILDVNKIKKNYGYKQLFEEVSFTLNDGDLLGLVGPNGCGKSTLLKIIMGLEQSDEGTINIKKNTKIGYLDQMNSNMEGNVYDILKSAFTEINEIENKLKLLEPKENEKYNAKKMEKYCALLEQYNMIGGYEIDSKIKSVINGLKIDENILSKNYKNLSGGEKTLISLSLILLKEPNLLILDEPTNHLDLKRIEVLEQYIKTYKGASIIVSHDRYFLDKVTNHLLALNNGIGKIYNTNYSDYLLEKTQEIEKQLSKYDDEQNMIKELETKAKYFMTLGMNRNSSTLTKQGKVLWERAQRMRENGTKKPIIEKKLNISFQEKAKSSKKIIEL